MAEVRSEFVSVTTEKEGALQLHSLVAGDPQAETVLLLHGWPTSSFLWRKMLPALGEQYHAVALDLPGFGQSDKPLDASYSFRCYERVLDAYLDATGLGPVHLVVHDLGGPVGLFWAVHHPDKLRSVTLLNTIVFPELSWAVVAFMMGLKLPGVRHWLTSPSGLAFAMRFGVQQKKQLTPDVIAGYQQPFAEKSARLALIKSAMKLHPKGLATIAEGLPSLNVPMRLLYAKRDRILPAVAKDFERLHALIPEAELTSFPDAGHFLQEDIPGPLCDALLAFWAKATASRS